jgi:hypothetical protein
MAAVDAEALVRGILAVDHAEIHLQPSNAFQKIGSNGLAAGLSNDVADEEDAQSQSPIYIANREPPGAGARHAR